MYIILQTFTNTIIHVNIDLHVGQFVRIYNEKLSVNLKELKMTTCSGLISVSNAQQNKEQLSAHIFEPPLISKTSPISMVTMQSSQQRIRKPTDICIDAIMKYIVIVRHQFKQTTLFLSVYILGLMLDISRPYEYIDTSSAVSADMCGC